ncbi:unnamed protein product, partial [Rotaria magnacalcarata]
YRSRGRAYSRSHPAPFRSTEYDFNIVPNNQYRWSLDFKEIPYFLAVLDNRNRARLPDARSHHKHPCMLFIADDYGRIGVYSLPQPTNNVQLPSIIGTGELFPKNSRLLMESFTVYEFAIVVYVRRFEQRSNEIEHSKLIKAGLPIMKGEQDEEIVLDFFEEDFEPTSMIQSNESIGLIDSEHDSYRLYAKDDQFRLITTYQNAHNQQWKLTNGVIFKDNRTLLKFIEDKSYDVDDSNARNNRNTFHNSPRRCLIELTPDGQEKRQIQADTLYSMVLGSNDELILGFAIRGDHGVIHCY